MYQGRADGGQDDQRDVDHHQQPRVARRRAVARTSRPTSCTTGTPRLPPPALTPSAQPLSRCRVVGVDVGHRRGEVAAADAGERRHDQQRRVRDAGLQEDRDQHRRDQQQQRADDGPVPAAERRRPRRCTGIRSTAPTSVGRAVSRNFCRPGRCRTPGRGTARAPTTGSRPRSRCARTAPRRSGCGWAMAWPGRVPEVRVLGAPVVDPVPAEACSGGRLMAVCRSWWWCRCRWLMIESCSGSDGWSGGGTSTISSSSSSTCAGAQRFGCPVVEQPVVEVERVQVQRAEHDRSVDLAVGDRPALVRADRRHGAHARRRAAGRRRPARRRRRTRGPRRAGSGRAGRAGAPTPAGRRPSPRRPPSGAGSSDRHLGQDLQRQRGAELAGGGRFRALLPRVAVGVDGVLHPRRRGRPAMPSLSSTTTARMSRARPAGRTRRCAPATCAFSR